MGKKKTQQEIKHQQAEENREPRHSDAPNVPKLWHILFGRPKK